MERIAIISDIHSNLQALKATLNDIKSRNIKKIYCLGDIASKGLHPSECIKLVRENCEIIIAGNSEKLYCLPDIEYTTEKLINDRYRDIYENVSEEDRIFLSNLPYCYEFYMSGRLVRLIHAHPTSIGKCICSFDNVKEKIKLFYPSENTISNEIADILIYGHVHMQMMEKMYNRTFLNPGSIGESVELIRNNEVNGNNLETTNTQYLIIEGDIGEKNKKTAISFQFVRVPYDIEKELKNCNKDTYLNELRNGIYSECDTIFKVYKERNINTDF